MAKQRKTVHKVRMTEGKRAIIQQLFQEYNITRNFFEDCYKLSQNMRKYDIDATYEYVD